MKQNLFDKGSELTSLKIKTENYEFIEEALMEVEIKWSVRELKSEAYIVVLEKKDFLNSFKTFKPESNVISLYIEDSKKDKLTGKNGIFERNFIFTEITEVKDEETGSKAHQIKMIDSLSYYLKKTYFSKGYNSATFSDIFNDIISIHKLDSFLPKEATIEVSNSKKIHSNFVIPNNMSLYDFLMFQADREGMIIFQDKNGFYLKSIEDLYVKNINKIDTTKTFKQDVQDPLYEYKIGEVLSSFASNFRNLKFPKRITHVYDFKNKLIQEKKKNFDEIYSDMNFSNASEDYIQNTEGVYHSIAEKELNDLALVKQTYMNYLENNNAAIIVFGHINGNKLLELREIDILGSTAVTDGYKKGNETLNGGYIVLDINDKILGNKYIQKIVLGRINNTNKG